MSQAFRYPRTWQWIGFLAIFLSVAFPLLMYWNNEHIDGRVITALAAMTLAGVWCYLHFKRYEVTFDDEGFVVRRLWREPFSAAWREIVTVSAPSEEEVLFETSDHRTVKISIYFPALEPLLSKARQKLPEVVWSVRRDS